MAVLTQNAAHLMEKGDHYIGFHGERQFVHRKLAKIAENSDHNIGPLNWAGRLLVG
jgi:hypothetical protein